ncbi:hypothetical protein HNQ60_001357 [Povalibacter uvarum]|uniref:Uncharacterized protein n=1 Tax=Povalibacter uvarum TaxID=732238 RepID=A0A841HJB8_9GAMM|nr:hypothetical protein [Povalibacter uvarum]MBB6092479.1 hypothetical protein [Povalibacter uvarum]
MYTIIELSNRTERAVCAVLSVTIVAVVLALGAAGIESTAHLDYSVTVTQLS